MTDSTAAANAMTDPWLVIQTQPRAEVRALDHLARQGFISYCPMVLKRTRHARRVVESRRALFPSYVFVAYASAVGRWRPILSTVGVRTVVRNGDQPSLLDGRIVEALRRSECDGVIVQPTAQFQIGEQVTLEGGAMAGFVGEVVAIRGPERVLLLLKLLNQDIRTLVPTDMLRTLAARAS